MAALNVMVLKQILDNIPESYVVEVYDGSTTFPLNDKVEVDISNERIILK